MTRISGDLVSIGIGKESTRGTAVAATYWIRRGDLVFDDKVQKVTDEGAFGVLDKTLDGHIVKQWGEGNFGGNVYRNSIGLILAALFGQAPTTTTVETTAKKHTNSLSQTNTGLSLTVAVKEANLDLRMALAVLDYLKIDYAVDKYITFDAGFISKKSAAASNTTAFAAETKFIPKHTVFKVAATGASNLTAASAITNIKSISIEFKRNVEATQGLGSVDLENNVNKEFEVTFKIEKFYDDTTFKDYVFNNTHRSMRVDLIDTDTTVGATTNPSLRFDFDEVLFTDWSKNSSTNNVVTETITGVGLFNITAGKTVSSELVNDVASY
jgi:hypothetical protein